MSTGVAFRPFSSIDLLQASERLRRANSREGCALWPVAPLDNPAEAGTAPDNAARCPMACPGPDFGLPTGSTAPGGHVPRNPLAVGRGHVDNPAGCPPCPQPPAPRPIVKFLQTAPSLPVGSSRGPCAEGRTGGAAQGGRGAACPTRRSALGAGRRPQAKRAAHRRMGVGGTCSPPSGGHLSPLGRPARARPLLLSLCLWRQLVQDVAPAPDVEHRPAAF